VGFDPPPCFFKPIHMPKGKNVAILVWWEATAAFIMPNPSTTSLEKGLAEFLGGKVQCLDEVERIDFRHTQTAEVRVFVTDDADPLDDVPYHIVEMTPLSTY